jgi:hypothetical protein
MTMAGLLYNSKIFLYLIKSELSSKGIEPLTVFNQFFYREPPLPIGSPALICYYNFPLLCVATLHYRDKGAEAREHKEYILELS